MSASIIVNSYPLEVTVRTRMVRLTVTLATGLLPQNIAVRTSRASSGVALYQDTTVPVSAGPFSVNLGGGQYYFYLRLNPGFANAALVANAITLFDSVSGDESAPFYIAMSRNKWQSVTTMSDYGDADDFNDPATALNRDKWEVQTSQATPNIVVAGSILTLGTPATANRFTTIESEIYDGYPRVIVRRWREAARLARTGFFVGVNLYEEHVDLSGQSIPPASSTIWLGFNCFGFATVVNPAQASTLVNFAGSGITLPGGAVTTV